MGFRENLLRKIQIDQLVDQVGRSLRPADPPRRIDRAAMQTLLQMGSYTHRHERDLDLYCKEGDAAGTPSILVLDNELKIYRTTIDDVALRKSPTLKEMISIRNAIKILSDKDVVVSSKLETLRQVQKELMDELDLSYSRADMEALEQDGRESLKNNYTEGIVEVLTLFCELLDYVKAPKAFQLRHYHVWGAVDKSMDGAIQMGPIVLFSLVHNALKMIRHPISTLDKAAMQRFEQAAKTDARADMVGEAVLAELKEMAMEKMKDER